MDERKTIFDYLAQVMCIFGFTILFISVVIKIIGEDIETTEISFFIQNGESLSIHTIFQFFLLSILIVILRYLFMTDCLIKKWSLIKRTVAMVCCVLAVSCIFIVIFNWFPLANLRCWSGFGVSFVCCFIAAILVTSIKEKMENKKLEESLIKLQKSWEEQDDK